MCDGTWRGNTRGGHAAAAASSQPDVTQGDHRKRQTLTENREPKEACAPEIGHIYREQDRNMGHMTRNEAAGTGRELMGYSLQQQQHGVGRQAQRTEDN